MEQWFLLGGEIKISFFAPKEEIGKGQSRGYRAWSELFELVREQDKPAGDERENDDEREGGKEPTNAANIEFGDVDFAVIVAFGQQQSRNEKAAEDEEGIDAEVPVRAPIGAGVKNEDAEQGDGAKPFDFGEAGFTGWFCRRGRFGHLGFVWDVAAASCRGIVHLAREMSSVSRGEGWGSAMRRKIVVNAIKNRVKPFRGDRLRGKGQTWSEEKVQQD